MCVISIKLIQMSCIFEAVFDVTVAVILRSFVFSATIKTVIKTTP